MTQESDFKDISVETLEPNAEPPKKKKKMSPVMRYLLNISIILIATAAALALTLSNDFNSVVEAFSTCDWRYLLLIVGLMILFFAVESFILFLFARLYSRKYKYHQAVACDMIGTFYNSVTPSSSGGQIMQARAYSKQGVPISNAASILVMFFIVYQFVLVGYGILSFIFKYDLINGIGGFDIMGVTIPIWPLTIFGFALNLTIVGLLFLMSYSHKFHNFIMKHGVNLFVKLHLVKNPQKTRDSLRVQVENFRIELRRLQSNVPFTILIVLLFVILLTIRFSIPFFAGLALNGLSQSPTIYTFWDACFMSSYHQMVTGLIPLPGSAGVSEIFFSSMFYNQSNPAAGFYSTIGATNAALIIWRTATFTLPLFVAGIVSAFYKAAPTETVPAGTSPRQTFVDLQLSTFEERKMTSDISYETSQLSRKAIQERFIPKRKTIRRSQEYNEDNAIVYFEASQFYARNKKKKGKNVRPLKRDAGDYTEINISNEDQR